MKSKIIKRGIISLLLIAALSAASSFYNTAIDPAVKSELSVNAVNGGYSDFAAQSLYHQGSKINYTLIAASLLTVWTLFPIFSIFSHKNDQTQ